MQINEAYERLRPLYRNIIDMKVNKNLSNEQISKETDFSETQVRDILHRARNRLRKFIND